MRARVPGNGEAVRALVTNDDGIDSPGLHALARVAVAAGLEVTVAAPHEESSGSSAAVSAVHSSGRLALHRHELPGVDAVRTLSVEASPGFIAFAGIRGAFGEPPDVVLSGVNKGPNTGRMVLHSGTVGAALTATTHGLPGLAVSLEGAADWTAEHAWDTAEEAAARALRWLLAHPPGPVVVNVNVPDVPPDRLRGLCAARLAPHGAVQVDVGEAGEDFVTLTYRETPEAPAPGSDVALLREGWATVTLLGPPAEVPGAGYPGLGSA
ncbi:5'-nucleotidase [Geodermatophilus telluris]|uniref:5'-nucleotidase n=1 Tax=Geodermatophilus telluris TaxID=1190417 RepID=A0A1G6TIL4_9ACTN|nr:5'/3'-nucleotidase SurE [Geodermatophilus telluris]SDD28366.1 5'-nucleotidase [Geodermatophilus telluris]